MKLPKSFALNLLDSKMRHFFAKESNKWNEKGPWRFPSVCYTLEHKLAFLEREHYLTGHYSLRGIFHDWEKPFLYITPWIKDEKKIQEMHRNFSPHHMGCAKTSKAEHLIEMYIDWDCAAITKPDKPLNAFETLLHWYPEYINIMLPVCLAMDITSVKPEIYIHPWHELNKNHEYNEYMYKQVQQVLDAIIRRLPSNENQLRLMFNQAHERNIIYCHPTEIFFLILQQQQKNLKFEVNLQDIRKKLENVAAKFRVKKCFIGSDKTKPVHDYKKIQKSAFAV